MATSNENELHVDSAVNEQEMTEDGTVTAGEIEENLQLMKN